METYYPKNIINTVYVNTVNQRKIFYLPPVSTIPPGTPLYIKDICGNAATSSIILSTSGYFDTIDYNASYISTTTNIVSPSYSILSTNGASVMLMPDGKTNWMTLQNNTNNPVYGSLGYSTSLYCYFYDLITTSVTPLNGAFNTSPLGPGNQGWSYQLLATTQFTIDYINYVPPGKVGAPNNWGFAAKGYIYSSTNTTIQFRVVYDDAMTVFFNNSTVVSQWTVLGSNTTTSASVPIYAGYNPVKITYFQNSGGSRVTFSWAMPAGTQFISNGTRVLYYNESSKYWP